MKFILFFIAVFVFNVEAQESKVAATARKQCEGLVEFYIDKNENRCKKAKEVKDGHLLHYQFSDCGNYGEKIEITYRNVPSVEAPLLKSHHVCVQEFDTKIMQVSKSDKGEIETKLVNVKNIEITRYFDNTTTKETIHEGPDETRRTLFPDTQFYLTCSTSNDSKTKCKRENTHRMAEKHNLRGVDVDAPTPAQMNEIRKGASVASVVQTPAVQKALVKPPGAI